MLLVGYSKPLVIAPINEFETAESSILFLVEKAEKILIDDNIEFASPEEIEVTDGEIIKLNPGIYYWKAVGILESEIRKFTINSRVDLKLKKIEGENYGIVNIGNTKLNVEIYNDSLLIDKIKLDIDEEKKSEGTKFIGRQRDE